jgi:uncharacterized protein (TIGR03435 family)
LRAGRYSTINQSLYSLILEAYDLPQVTVMFALFVGGRTFAPPRRDDRCDRNCSSTSQILNAHFDIIATLPQGVPSTQQFVRPMLRTLLEERFQLRTRRETRDIPVYALRVATPGKLGPKLRPSSADCRAWAAARSAARQEAERTGAPLASPAEPKSIQGAPLCTAPSLMGPDGLGIRGAGVLADLVSNIQRMERPIVDRTGLTGTFEWELISGIRLDGPNGQWIPPDAPPLDTALRDQLGLRLEAQTAQSEALIIDSVRMPSEN